jgi:sortase A
MKRALHLIRGILLGSALALLGYCAFVLVDTRVFQNRERRQLETLLNEAAVARAHNTQPPPAPAGLIGRIEIPRLDVSVIVIEGSTEAILRHAAGHIAGTALPGEPGNVGISAHRDTFFRPLRNIRRDDVITVTTLLGVWRYRVVSTRIVPPSDTSVLNRGPSQVLTLVTCYPFYFVGASPDRFIVRAERIT